MTQEKLYSFISIVVPRGGNVYEKGGEGVRTKRKPNMLVYNNNNRFYMFS